MTKWRRYDCHSTILSLTGFYWLFVLFSLLYLWLAPVLLFLYSLLSCVLVNFLDLILSFFLCICWARSIDPRHLEMILARTRHQKIARPSRDCSNNLEMELLQLKMISITDSWCNWLYLFLRWSLIGPFFAHFIRTYKDLKIPDHLKVLQLSYCSAQYWLVRGQQGLIAINSSLLRQ